MKCNCTFSSYYMYLVSYFKKHYQKCKVKLTGKIGAEDYRDLMCKRMVNYEDVGAFDHIIKFIK